jgi:hypothetical protein
MKIHNREIEQLVLMYRNQKGGRIAKEGVVRARGTKYVFCGSHHEIDRHLWQVFHSYL